MQSDGTLNKTSNETTVGDGPFAQMMATGYDQMDTIDSIESQFKDGALADETSQLKVAGQRLDILPSDVVAKLPYTTDDKKEKIPVRQIENAVKRVMLGSRENKD